MGWKGWNKVGTPTNTSIQTSLGHLPHLECPKCGQRAILSVFWPLFGPHRATFGTFIVWKMAQTFLPGCLHWCSNLVPPLPTQNMPSELICVAKILFSSYFCPFLAPIGPHLGHSWSGKWAKLINLYVLGAVPTIFQLVS